jgi:LPXTG-motif cell wall-anchored protein
VTFELLNPDSNGNATAGSSVKITVTATDDVGVYSVNFNLRLASEDKSYTSYYGGGWYQADNESSKQGWTVDGNTYSYTYTLDNAAQYSGYVYLSNIWVEDAQGNVDNYQNADYSNKAPMGLGYGFHLAGTDAVPQETEDGSFTVASAGVYDTDGNAYQTGTVIVPDTTVVYRVTTAEALPVDTIQLLLSSDLTNTDQVKWVTLEKKENSNTYEAQFTFTEKMYPTAWEASYLCYNYNNIEYYAFSGSSDCPEMAELVLQVGNNVVYPTISSLSTYVYTYDDESLAKGWFGYDYSSYQIYEQTIPKFSKLTDVITLPTAPSYTIDGESIPSCWYVYTWQWNSETDSSKCVCKGKAEDYIITDSDGLTIVAKPEGYTLAEIIYPADNGEGVESICTHEWVKGTTNEDIISAITNKYKNGCTNLGDVNFYVASDTGYDFVVVNYKATNTYIYLYGTSVFEDEGKLYWGSYLVSDGFYDRSTVTADELIAKFSAETPDEVTGATFEGWNFETDEIESKLAELKNNGGVYYITAASAQYDKDVAAADYYLKGSNGDYSYLDEYVGFYEKGTSADTILADLKKQAPGNYVSWELIYQDNNSFATIYEFMTDGTKTSSASSNKTQSSGTASTSTESAAATTATYKAEAAKTEVNTETNGEISVSSTVAFDTQSTATENGTTKLSDTAVAEVVSLIRDTVKEAAAQTTNGTVATSTVTVNMADATVIPTDILNAAKGQDVDVEFVMTDENGQEYTWTINGNSITEENLKDVNLKVNMGTDNIPSAIVNSTVGDQQTVQLNLESHGLFGFTADLRIYVGKEYAGQYASLYYYTNGRLEIQNSCVIDADGYTTLRFTHASDYVIAIENQPEITAANTDVISSPNTGDDNHVGLLMMIFAAGLVLVVGAAVYRRKRA